MQKLNLTNQKGISGAWLLLIVLVLLIVALLVTKPGNDANDKVAEETGQAFEISLRPVGAAQVSGKARIVEINGHTNIEIALAGDEALERHPANVYNGSCQALESIRYQLTAIEDGVSESVLEATTYGQLRSELPLALIINESFANPSAYLACGDLIFPL